MSEDFIKNTLNNINYEIETEKEWVEPLGLDRETWKQLLNYIDNKDKEIERLNYIINELELWLKHHSKIDYESSEIIIHEQLALNLCLQYLQDLKGEIIEN